MNFKCEDHNLRKNLNNFVKSIKTSWILCQHSAGNSQDFIPIWSHGERTIDIRLKSRNSPVQTFN